MKSPIGANDLTVLMRLKATDESTKAFDGPAGIFAVAANLRNVLCCRNSRAAVNIKGIHVLRRDCGALVDRGCVIFVDDAMQSR